MNDPVYQRTLENIIKEQQRKIEFLNTEVKRLKAELEVTDEMWIAEIFETSLKYEQALKAKYEPSLN